MSGRLAALLTACLAQLLCAPPADAQSDGTSPAAVLNPLSALPKSNLSGFRDRPLFNPSRTQPRPQEAVPVIVEAAPPPPPPEPIPNLRLIGIITGQQDVALVRRDEGSKTLTLATGDHIGPWTVTVMPPTGLRLRDEGRVADYVLFAPGPHGVAPKPESSNPPPAPTAPPAFPSTD